MGWTRMLAQPRLKFGEPQRLTVVQAVEKTVSVGVVKRQVVSIDAQKCCGDGHGDAFVSIEERMILRQALP